MRQDRFEAMSPPAHDDVWTENSRLLDDINLKPVERGISTVLGAILMLSGLHRGSLPRLLGGGALLYRGFSGFCPLYRALESSAGMPLINGLQIEESISVNSPAEQVYGLWRRLENLPRFMSHIESVTTTGDNQSHWVAKIPSPLRLEWDAVITDEQENRKFSWRSLPGSSVHHAGSVFFHPIPGRRGTEVKIIFSYKPPVGSVGTAAAKLVKLLTENQIRSDLRAFKAVAETGEKPTTAGQPSGRSRGTNGRVAAERFSSRPAERY